jgi:pimeloyl-ACP methyl ester carboxylesterase
MSYGFFHTRDGCRLAYVDEGRGTPVLWQHGLGADRGQPAEVFPAIDGIRRITLECRGHGQSELGELTALSIEQFANDAIDLLDTLEIPRAIVGGISLGAAISLRLAVTQSERVSGLILARPAWIADQAPQQLQIYREVARLLARYGPDEGEKRLNDMSLLREVEMVSPDNAASMRGFFRRHNPMSTIELLHRIPAQGPGISRADIAGLSLPALVIANGQDFVHPVETAITLRDLIVHSTFRLIASKTESRARYVAEFGQSLREFLEPSRSPA